MDIQSHKRTLGILHIVYGSLITIAFIFIGSLVSIMFPFIADEIAKDVGNDADEILFMVSGIIRTVFILLLIFSAVPSIIAGVGLLQGKSWAPVIALIAGCICIFSFPFGTAVGVYSIYVFVENNKANNDQNKG
ncbi:hypothetical protein SAMN05421640_1560 [Ekhidna lutea]|uniref:DUF4064 domain-containing protein n=1 Tax=Ekhidna lutea TaxID=447679 RepID=A0A239HX98_EKHLU|nr:hypothetical protein [Ekhidna lutea]SNS86010.1 hypothetical protein SAMN05421640_1560 [Ekhidna lutea]